jgi:hypothetical protein
LYGHYIFPNDAGRRAENWIETSIFTLKENPPDHKLAVPEENGACRASI